MIVIKRGKMPLPWWVNMIFECPTCQCEFRLEETDNVHVVRTRDREEQEMVRCPTCYQPLGLKK